MKKTYQYTPGEELANTVSHGAMAALVLLSMPFAILHVNARSDLTSAIGISIFCISIFLMLLSSTLFHSMAKDTPHKRVFKIFDHIFIYVAIAGSYTAVALSVIRGWQAIVIICIQWGAVIAGLLHKTLSDRKNPRSSVAVYLIMGWTLLAFLPLFIQKASLEILLFILFGGLAYSAGAMVYAKKPCRYFHMIWHIFVNLGVALHFVGLVFFL